MALSVLYIGGTGQISLPCVEASVAAGHEVTVLNRGQTRYRCRRASRRWSAT